MTPHTPPVAFAVEHPRYTPTRANDHDAGFDLRARTAETLVLEPGERTIVPTGVYVALEPGYAGLVCPRSGLASKSGVTVLNAPGIIDSGYRGEIGVVVYNASLHGGARDTGDETGHPRGSFAIRDGDRIAQLVVQRVATDSVVVPMADLPSPGDARGTGGFGSTGV